MKNCKAFRVPGSVLILAMVAVFVTACKSNQNNSSEQATTKPAEAAAVESRPVIRIKAGLTTPFTDAAGNVWLADAGFDGGDVVTRDGEPQIANTKDQGLYRSEHFGMAGFSYAVPNGKYTVKLHFAETYDQVTEAGQRVFSFNVQGKDFKDFDVLAKAGGPLKAYVETVPVEVNNGKLTITFTPNVENPEINGIEIAPN